MPEDYGKYDGLDKSNAPNGNKVIEGWCDMERHTNDEFIGISPFDLIGPGDKGYSIKTKNTDIERPQPPGLSNHKMTINAGGISVEIPNHKVGYPKENQDIVDSCEAMKEFLIAKNTKYGNSALEPLRTFSKADSEEQLLIRMDDKLSRIKNATEPRMNDIVDLTGYLHLYIIKKGWTEKIKEMID